MISKSRIKKMRLLFRLVIEITKYYILYIFAMMIYGRRDIWIISENGHTARDNGYHFYKYIRENHPEIEAYYIIKKDSEDISKIEQFGNVINYRSIKHYLLFISSKMKISSYVMGYSTDKQVYLELVKRKYLRKLLNMKGKMVFLQHGIIKDDLPALYKENTCVDLFICGAKPEYDYVKNCFHYDNEVKYTGLARFDNLHEIDVINQILIMPTWRNWFNNDLKYETRESILNSKYVKMWNHLLNNPDLHKILKANDMKLVFYPHYAMQKYIDMFSTNSDQIIIADFAHYDVQQLLKESKLLVTDYSSVYFDFAYMKKPIVYYQFDKDEYRQGHYPKGYFEYETMGFGEVVEEETELIELIQEYINSSGSLKEMFTKRINNFFELYDKNNCSRIFDEIMKL